MKTRTILILAAALLAFAQSAVAQLYFLQDGNGSYYRLDTTTGAATLVTTIPLVTSSTIGLTEGPAGFMYATTWTNLISFHSDGTVPTTIGPSGAEGLAYCIPSGILYGSINGAFFTVNQTTGAQSALASPPGNADVEGLACDHKNNVVYGLAGNGGPKGNLYRYTPGTDSWALVGNTGVLFDLDGLAMDANAGVLYGLGVQDGNLYRINPLTAASSVVGPTGLGAVGGGLGFVPIAQAQVPVPTLSDAMMLLLAAALAAIAAFTFMRQRGGSI